MKSLLIASILGVSFSVNAGEFELIPYAENSVETIVQKKQVGAGVKLGYFRIKQLRGNDTSSFGFGIDTSLMFKDYGSYFISGNYYVGLSQLRVGDNVSNRMDIDLSVSANKRISQDTSFFIKTGVSNLTPEVCFGIKFDF